jgi:hypothetical protein
MATLYRIPQICKRMWQHSAPAAMMLLLVALTLADGTSVKIRWLLKWVRDQVSAIALRDAIRIAEMVIIAAIGLVHTPSNPVFYLYLIFALLIGISLLLRTVARRDHWLHAGCDGALGCCHVGEPVMLILYLGLAFAIIFGAKIQRTRHLARIVQLLLHMTIGVFYWSMPALCALFITVAILGGIELYLEISAGRHQKSQSSPQMTQADP